MAAFLGAIASAAQAVGQAKRSVYSFVFGDYTCSQDHKHGTAEERDQCNKDARDRQNQEHELKMKQTDQEGEIAARMGFCGRNKEIILCIFSLVALVIIAGIVIAILYGVGILFQED